MTDSATPRVKALQKGSVHIKDRQKVNDLLKALKNGGENNLQVIADFDMTLSQFTHNGERCVSCHKAIDDNPRLPDLYREKANALRAYYYPLEIDPNIPHDEKYQLMEEWYKLSHNLLVDFKFNQKKLKAIVQESRLILRDGCHSYFTHLEEHQIPLLIFSAGLGDVIEEAINIQSTVTKNMKIVSNFMEFDKQGALVGFKSDVIHPLNKNESAIHDSDYFKQLRHRENLILLGDSLGDLRMADGATNVANILKVGFLNDKISERLDSYMKAYDIVLVSDETMDVPNGILQYILQ